MPITGKNSPEKLLKNLFQAKNELEDLRKNLNDEYKAKVAEVEANALSLTQVNVIIKRDHIC